MNDLTLKAFESIEIILPFQSTAAAIVLSAIFGEWIAIIYRKYGASLSNRKVFSDVFWLLCVTTTIVIMVVKFSIALSLGLVGALSIVRFRAAIKEPEELVYLFLVIAIGISCGAGQFKAALIVMIITSVVFFARHKYYLKKINNSKNEYFTGVIFNINGPSQKVQIPEIFFQEVFGNKNYSVISLDFQDNTFNGVYKINSDINKEDHDKIVNWATAETTNGLKIKYGTQTFLSP